VSDMNNNELPEEGSGTPPSETQLCCEAGVKFYSKIFCYVNNASEPVDGEVLWGEIEKVSILFINVFILFLSSEQCIFQFITEFMNDKKCPYPDDTKTAGNLKDVIKGIVLKDCKGLFEPTDGSSSGDASNIRSAEVSKCHGNIYSEISELKYFVSLPLGLHSNF
jgi:hypothetical protein